MQQLDKESRINVLSSSDAHKVSQLRKQSSSLNGWWGIVNFSLHASLVFWEFLLSFLLSTAACFTLVISNFEISGFSISKPSETRKEVVTGRSLHGRRTAQSSAERQMKRTRGTGLKSALLLTHPATSGGLPNHSGSLWRGLTGRRHNPF